MPQQPTIDELQTENAELKRKLAALESAAVEMLLASQPIMKWGTVAVAEELRRSAGLLRLALKDIRSIPGCIDRLRDLAARVDRGEVLPSLAELADRADAEARQRAGFRADVEG